MITKDDVQKFFDEMDFQLDETRRLMESEENLMKAVEEYEKVWGVKIKIPLATEEVKA